jgi:hypothetical protein
MKNLLPYSILLIGSSVLSLLSASPAAAAENPYAIVQKAVAHDQILLQQRSIYDCTAISIREKLDRESQVTATEKESLTLRASQSPDYETRKARPEVKGMESDLKKASQEEPFNILNIIDHFDYELEGQEKIQGVPCYKIRFRPKKDQPFRNREEKVANQLSGYFWVSLEDFTLMKNQGSLTKPVSVAWFFATLRELDFSFESRQLPNGDFGPAKIQYRFRVAVPFGQIHERHTRLMTDYRKASKGL